MGILNRNYDIMVDKYVEIGVEFTVPRELKVNRVLNSEKLYEDALKTLSTALDEPNFNEYVRDAIIQRFEYTYETAWKLIKAVLSYQGIELRHPKEIFAEAFASGWIMNPDNWEAMIEDRNLTSHTYKERTAEAVYLAIKGSYYLDFLFLQRTITEVIRRYVQSSGEH